MRIIKITIKDNLVINGKVGGNTITLDNQAGGLMEVNIHDFLEFVNQDFEYLRKYEDFKFSKE